MHKHVIGHYYLNRRENLCKIIGELNRLNIRPLVWNNSGEPFRPVGLDCDTCDSPNNPIHGRYLAALIYPEFEVFLFQDDDLMIRGATIDRLVNAATADHSKFYGIEGRAMSFSDPNPYINCRSSRFPENTDMVVRVYACHRTALGFGLNWILEHGIHPGRSETVLFTGNRSKLVEDTDWLNLPENKTGLSWEGNHDAEIDTFIKTWMI